MAGYSPRPRRRLLGLSSRDVEHTIASRDAALRAAYERLEAAEQEAKRAGEEAARLRQERDQARARAQEAEAALRESHPDLPDQAFAELARAVAATEDWGAEILDRAQAVSQEGVAEARRDAHVRRAEAARVNVWRERIVRASGPALGALEEAHGEIEATPERVREAVKPIVEALEALHADLSRLARTSAYPGSKVYEPEVIHTLEELTGAEAARRDPPEPESA